MKILFVWVVALEQNSKMGNKCCITDVKIIEQIDFIEKTNSTIPTNM